MIVIFVAALALCALFTKPHATGWNDGSRLATVDALTADHTFQIDRSPFAAGLGDEIRFRGRTYSDKPPLLAVLGAAVAFVLAPFGISLRHAPGPAIYLVTLLTVGVAFALGCCYAYAFARLLGCVPRVATAVATLTGTATLALPYATVLTNHVPCGASALAATYHLYRARDGGPRHVALGGLLLGLCYAFDAAGAMFAIAAAVLLWGAPLRRWALCAAAGLPIIALQLLYNLAISGSVLPTVFNLSVWSDPSLPLHAESATVLKYYTPAEYAGFAVSLLVGARGLFAYTPLMLVAAYGFAVMWRDRAATRRLALAILSTAAVFFVTIVFLQNDAHAHNFGERRYVDLFFVLCVALGPALEAIRRPLAAAAVLALTGISVAIAALGTVAPFGGGPGESGFAYATVEFAALARRAPVQGVIDVVLLAVAVVLVVRTVARALATSGATTTEAPQRG